MRQKVGAIRLFTSLDAALDAAVAERGSQAGLTWSAAATALICGVLASEGELPPPRRPRGKRWERGSLPYRRSVRIPPKMRDPFLRYLAANFSDVIDHHQSSGRTGESAAVRGLLQAAISREPGANSPSPAPRGDNAG